MSYPTYTVTVTREDNLWVAVVTDGLEEGFVGANDFERFADVDPGMREVIADLTGIPPAQFNVTWRYEFNGENATALVLEFQEANRIAEDMVEWRDKVRSHLVSELGRTLSQRAIADLLGLSHQRVNQIAHAPSPDFSLELPEVDQLADAIRRSLHVDRETFLAALAQFIAMTSMPEQGRSEGRTGTPAPA
jgi:predicted XRE-type DNA-binding protein